MSFSCGAWVIRCHIYVGSDQLSKKLLRLTCDRLQITIFQRVPASAEQLPLRRLSMLLVSPSIIHHSKDYKNKTQMANEQLRANTDVVMAQSIRA